jgi:heptosyltransferase-2
VLNLQRFANSGLITMLSKADKKIGFDKNPLSFAYDIKVKHEIQDGTHETERNLKLIEYLSTEKQTKPRLYFSAEDSRLVADLVSEPYVVIAPASVWYTKQFPLSKWVELIKNIPAQYTICLLGAGNDVKYCEQIIAESERENILDLAGKLTFLESAALMKKAVMNFVNDSAPMHFASAVNAPTTAIFCSTIPEFGFGPMADEARILQAEEKLDCRPCGLHGFKNCPQGHFKCAMDINIPVNLL